MNDPANPQMSRRRFDGLMRIARYNWPQYVCGLATMLAAGLWLWFDKDRHACLRLAAWIGASLAAWFCVASLTASHWIYDRSGLYRWAWISSALFGEPRRWLNLHAGLDDSSSAICQLFPAGAGRTCDFYDASEMSEPSIRRARAEQVHRVSERVDFRRLPFSNQSMDAVFLLFAAHELRRRRSREQLFRELFRVLMPGGVLLLVEHPRNLANFLGFGFGALHFFSRSEWLRVSAPAGFELRRQFLITPFVCVFAFRRPK